MDKSPLAFGPFAGKALAWLAVGYLASWRLAEQPFGLIVFSVFLFAVPVALAGAYSSTVNQVRTLSHSCLATILSRAHLLRPAQRMLVSDDCGRPMPCP